MAARQPPREKPTIAWPTAPAMAAMTSRTRNPTTDIVISSSAACSMFEQFFSGHVKDHVINFDPVDLPAQRVAMVFEEAGVDTNEPIVLQALAQHRGQFIIRLEHII